MKQWHASHGGQEGESLDTRRGGDAREWERKGSPRSRLHTPQSQTGEARPLTLPVCWSCLYRGRQNRGAAIAALLQESAWQQQEEQHQRCDVWVAGNAAGGGGGYLEQRTSPSDEKTQMPLTPQHCRPGILSVLAVLSYAMLW